MNANLPQSLDEMLALLEQSRRTQAAAEDCTLLPGDYDLLRAYAADDLPAEEAEVVEDFLAASPNWRHGLSEVIVQRVEQDRKQLAQLLGWTDKEQTAAQPAVRHTAVAVQATVQPHRTTQQTHQSQATSSARGGASSHPSTHADEAALLLLGGDDPENPAEKFGGSTVITTTAAGTVVYTPPESSMTSLPKTTRGSQPAAPPAEERKDLDQLIRSMRELTETLALSRDPRMTPSASEPTWFWSRGVQLGVIAIVVLLLLIVLVLLLSAGRQFSGQAKEPATLPPQSTAGGSPVQIDLPELERIQKNVWELRRDVHTVQHELETIKQVSQDAIVGTLDRSLFNLKHHTKGVTGARFLVDGTQLLTASEDGTASLIDLGTKEPRVIRNYLAQGRIVSLSMSASGRRFATACDDGKTRLWDVDSESVVAVVPGRAVAFHPSEDQCVTLSRGNEIRVFRGDTGQRIREFTLFPNRAEFGTTFSELGFDPTGTRFVLGTRLDMEARHMMPVIGWVRDPIRPLPQVWRFDTPDHRYFLPYAHTEANSFAFSPNKKWLAVSGSYCTVEGGGREDHPPPMIWSTRKRYSGEKTQFQKINILDAATGTILEAIEHPSYIDCLAYTSDSKLLIAGTADGHVLLLDLERRELVTKIHAHLQSLYFVSLSANDQLLATGGKDGSVKVWPLGAIRRTHAELHK